MTDPFESDDGGRGRRTARRWMVGGLFAHPPVAAALIIGGLGALDGVYTALLLILLPALGGAQSAVLDEVPLERLPVYASSAVTIALLGAVSAGLGIRSAGPAALGLVSLPVGTFAAWAAGVLVTGVLLTLVSLPLGRRLGIPETSAVDALMPRTAEEKLAFTGLSLLAGLGEELAYRGYLLAMLAPLVGPWGAVVLAAVPFSVLHGYQGWMGVARTAVLGLLLGVPLVVTGSLWPSVAAHAAIDIVLGAWLGERLLAREAGSR